MPPWLDNIYSLQMLFLNEQWLTKTHQHKYKNTLGWKHQGQLT